METPHYYGFGHDGADPDYGPSRPRRRSPPRARMVPAQRIGGGALPYGMNYDVLLQEENRMLESRVQALEMTLEEERRTCDALHARTMAAEARTAEVTVATVAALGPANGEHARPHPTAHLAADVPAWRESAPAAYGDAVAKAAAEPAGAPQFEAVATPATTASEPSHVVAASPRRLSVEQASRTTTRSPSRSPARSRPQTPAASAKPASIGKVLRAGADHGPSPLSRLSYTLLPQHTPMGDTKAVRALEPWARLCSRAWLLHFLFVALLVLYYAFLEPRNHLYHNGLELDDSGEDVEALEAMIEHMRKGELKGGGSSVAPLFFFFSAWGAGLLLWAWRQEIDFRTARWETGLAVKKWFKRAVTAESLTTCELWKFDEESEYTGVVVLGALALPGREGAPSALACGCHRHRRCRRRCRRRHCRRRRCSTSTRAHTPCPAMCARRVPRWACMGLVVRRRALRLPVRVLAQRCLRGGRHHLPVRPAHPAHPESERLCG